jgi:hypothetical protein
VFCSLQVVTQSITPSWSDTDENLGRFSNEKYSARVYKIATINRLWREQLDVLSHTQGDVLPLRYRISGSN